MRVPCRLPSTSRGQTAALVAVLELQRSNEGSAGGPVPVRGPGCNVLQGVLGPRRCRTEKRGMGGQNYGVLRPLHRPGFVVGGDSLHTVLAAERSGGLGPGGGGEGRATGSSTVEAPGAGNQSGTSRDWPLRLFQSPFPKARRGSLTRVPFAHFSISRGLAPEARRGAGPAAAPIPLGASPR